MDFIGEGFNLFIQGRGMRDLLFEGLGVSLELVLIMRFEKEMGSKIKR